MKKYYLGKAWIVIAIFLGGLYTSCQKEEDLLLQSFSYAENSLALLPEAMRSAVEQRV
ncbi:MAG: hypothetical protein LBG19_12510 [Prevotellaceae bacterium]|jgi:hypothetical protein|nr:hypothetical protein [Prevotellaceae bacterium]